VSCTVILRFLSSLSCFDAKGLAGVTGRSGQDQHGSAAKGAGSVIDGKATAAKTQHQRKATGERAEEPATQQGWEFGFSLSGSSCQSGDQGKAWQRLSA
jgi:hypothetical protein